jgi:hypothetical protein
MRTTSLARNAGRVAGMRLHRVKKSALRSTRCRIAVATQVHDLRPPSSAALPRIWRGSVEVAHPSSECFGGR